MQMYIFTAIDKVLDLSRQSSHTTQQPNLTISNDIHFYIPVITQLLSDYSAMTRG